MTKMRLTLFASLAIFLTGLLAGVVLWPHESEKDCTNEKLAAASQTAIECDRTYERACHVHLVNGICRMDTYESDALPAPPDSQPEEGD